MLDSLTTPHDIASAHTSKRAADVTSVASLTGDYVVADILVRELGVELASELSARALMETA